MQHESFKRCPGHKPGRPSGELEGLFSLETGYSLPLKSYCNLEVDWSRTMEGIDASESVVLRSVESYTVPPSPGLD